LTIKQQQNTYQKEKRGGRGTKKGEKNENCKDSRQTTLWRSTWPMTTVVVKKEGQQKTNSEKKETNKFFRADKVTKTRPHGPRSKRKPGHEGAGLGGRGRRNKKPVLEGGRSRHDKHEMSGKVAAKTRKKGSKGKGQNRWTNAEGGANSAA